MIRVKRAYDKPSPDDGLRILVDRLWPRGIKKEVLLLDEWMKEVSPSPELRKWYGHELDKWSQFVERYYKELDGKQDLCQSLLAKAKDNAVTLIFSSADTEHNSAVALMRYLEAKKVG